MNISPVSSSSNNIGSITGSNSSNQITRLQKQLQILQKQLEQVNQGSGDAQTKQQEAAQIEQLIAQIEAQIQQLESENTNQTQASGQQGASIDTSMESTLISSNSVNIQV